MSQRFYRVVFLCLVILSVITIFLNSKEILNIPSVTRYIKLKTEKVKNVDLYNVKQFECAEKPEEATLKFIHIPINCSAKKTDATPKSINIPINSSAEKPGEGTPKSINIPINSSADKPKEGTPKSITIPINSSAEKPEEGTPKSINIPIKSSTEKPEEGTPKNTNIPINSSTEKPEEGTPKSINIPINSSAEKTEEGTHINISNISSSEKIEGAKPKIIYMHNPAHWIDDWVNTSWESSKIFKSCKIANCVLSKDRSKFNYADAVMLRPMALKKCIRKVKTGQVWILIEHESPESFKNAFKPCHKNIFNWTYTYRRDSDFLLEHGYFKPNANPNYSVDLEHFLKMKNKSAVGFISNCNVPSKRDLFVKQLRTTGLDLDIYGECGNLRCDGSNRHKTSWNTTSAKSKCFDVLNTKYKFYFSFENALCVDYVTEKSLNLIMSRYIVPVIRDGSNHSLYHPPGSYIHTSSFTNTKDLTNYILNTGNDIQRYREYFNWRKHYSIYGIINVLQRNFCDICMRLHNPEKYRRLYGDISKFLREYSGEKVCHSPKDLVDIV